MPRYTEIVVAAATRRVGPLLAWVAEQGWDAGLAAEELAALLSERGIAGRVVTGTHDAARHVWIEAMGCVLDAEAGVPVAVGTPEAALYRGERDRAF